MAYHIKEHMVCYHFDKKSKTHFDNICTNRTQTGYSDMSGFFYLPDLQKIVSKTKVQSCLLIWMRDLKTQI